MKSNAVFINAVMDVRIEQGIFHFSLGEMVPEEGGKPDFIPAFRCALPADDAFNFFSYLRDKANDARLAGGSDMEVTKSVASSELDKLSRNDRSPSKVEKRRRISVSGGEPHSK
ncbi:hypothetical protein [Neptunicoccus sediminis]|uniref:hypothetical protein n=1 Tax=Neptunicoccus sediminis TaxID=1892596 RepID=UPI000845DAA4|nr:hypothetical protein [Neptunicoccus sediminis]